MDNKIQAPGQDTQCAKAETIQPVYAGQAISGTTANGRILGGMVKSPTVLEHLEAQRKMVLRQFMWYEDRIANLPKQDMYLSLETYEKKNSLYPPHDYPY